MAENRPLALLTGGTKGIGLAVAKGLVEAGFRLMLIGRDAAAGQTAVSQLEASGEEVQVRFLQLDLADPGQIRALPRELSVQCDSLDLLIHNAALVSEQRRPVSCGVDLSFAVNHLAVYLLTAELMPFLTRAPSARVVVTASQVEAGADLDLAALTDDHGYEKNSAYSRSKLANVLFTYELARRLTDSTITANCLHPGVVRTGLLDDLMRSDQSLERSSARVLKSGLRQLVGSTLRALKLRPPVSDWALTTEAGARTTLYAALDPELAEVSGVYLKDQAIAESSPQSRDEMLAASLWQKSAEWLEMSPDWPAL